MANQLKEASIKRMWSRVMAQCSEPVSYKNAQLREDIIRTVVREVASADGLDMSKIGEYETAVKEVMTVNRLAEGLEVPTHKARTIVDGAAFTQAARQEGFEGRK